MRIAVLCVSPELLGKLFFTGELHLRIDSKLPDDAKFIMARYNYRLEVFELYYESKEFASVPIPILSAPTFTTIPEEGKKK